ncbi:alpha/beta hydrolase [Patescibacteria group bacterium]|nr:alpha/beta hydrolase [Patescibacteria group bacterium]MCG2702629.1 alpha/beta hydrolase [Candidatus Parcubacteria bacterium]MBU4209921.1 alpha/beta hydrolase [Patescibacteria group bacterium]MBU4265477.1 alpha/beta hydrolase [Patescibacteria group bacterium]MBU4390527.1 alpha/beta hydrolase [Patescibacteria group bacterium]
MSPAIIPKKYCQIGKSRIAYIEAGDQNLPHLLFIHAWPSSSDMFIPVIHKLSRKFNILAPDLPGFGRSQGFKKKYTYKSFVVFIKKFLKAKNIEKTHLCGSSLGGAIALEFAYRYPKKVNKLILNAPPLYLYPFHKNKSEIVSFISKKFPSLTNNFLNKIKKNKLTYVYFLLRDHYQGIDRNFIKYIFEEAVKSKNKAVLDILKEIVNRDLRPHVSKIKAKTLIITGKDDYPELVKDTMYLKKHISNSKLFLIKNSNHRLSVCKSDIFSQTIFGFLQK